MTNARGAWLAELREALWSAHKWEGLATSRDLELDWEQKYVAQAVDMHVAQRAEVFIGNGVRVLSHIFQRSFDVLFAIRTVFEPYIQRRHAAHAQ